MADTIVTNTPGTSEGGSAGWMVALIILLAVIAGGVFLYRRGILDVPSRTTNINVTLPTPTVPEPITP